MRECVCVGEDAVGGGGGGTCLLEYTQYQTAATSKV